MKQLIAALLLATFSLLAMAKETITIVYSWGASDQAANFYRTLATESNKIQDKYNFIIDYKPGAGGSIAAKYVESNTNVILANSSALFIRPIFYPEGSHDPIMFKSIMPMCLAPLVIVSGKYKSWADVPGNKPITIGHSGNGSTTHLIAVQIAEKFPNLEIRSIFVKAAREESVKHANAQDYCVPNNQMAHGELDAWFTSQANYWKRVATPVVAKQ